MNELDLKFGWIDPKDYGDLSESEFLKFRYMMEFYAPEYNKLFEFVQDENILEAMSTAVITYLRGLAKSKRIKIAIG